MLAWRGATVQIQLSLKSFLAQEAPILRQLQFLVHSAHWAGNVHFLMAMETQNVL